LEVDDSVIRYVVEAGTDPVFGARPLKRFIQREIETNIARELIKGEIEPNSILHLEMDGTNLEIIKKEA
jgi:ATP-dependent Clp protease ATP-binding subunit ClpB